MEAGQCCEQVAATTAAVYQVAQGSIKQILFTRTQRDCLGQVFAILHTSCTGICFLFRIQTMGLNVAAAAQLQAFGTKCSK